MATNTGALTMIQDLIEDVQAGESVMARKANTVVAAIGTVLTILLGGATAWIESGTNIPSWLPGLVVVLGMVATTYRISQTKNGVTSSVADKLQSELTARIDLNHIHEPIDTRKAVLLASSEANEGLVGGTPILAQSEAEGKHRAAELRDEADALIDQHINRL